MDYNNLKLAMFKKSLVELINKSGLSSTGLLIIIQSIIVELERASDEEIKKEQEKLQKEQEDKKKEEVKENEHE